MATRNYYVVLGVSESESRDGIRRAFRDLAHRYHPDRAGPIGTTFFQEIVTAYRTLADPERRATYDAGLRAGTGRPEPVVARPWPDAPAEPLVPSRSSVMRDFHATRPSRDDVLSRIRRNFARAAAPKADRLSSLRLQLVISAADAAYGGVLTVTVPVFYPCERCRGAGVLEAFTCRACDGEGIAETEEPVHFRVPPGVRDGEEFQIPLRGLGSTTFV